MSITVSPQRNSIARRVLALAAMLAVAGLLYLALPFTLQTGFAAGMKLTNRASLCTWSQVWHYWPEVTRFVQIFEQMRDNTTVVRRDGDLELITTPRGEFWVRQEREPIYYLVAEHEWIASANPQDTVQSGDVVVDVGAHVGVFTAKALSLGARQVIAVEPDPRNLRCLERNFAKEIASGKVVIVPEGAWSTHSKLTLHLGTASGWNSFVEVPLEESGTLDVPVRPLDEMLSDLKVEKVNFIKMDIEGAEREALAGSLATLRRDRPRLMIDSYHLPDDPEVLPAVIRRAHADYELSCGPCEASREGPSRLIPHVTFYR